MKNKVKIFFVLLLAVMMTAQPFADMEAAAATAEPTTAVTKKTLYVGGDNYKIAFKNLTGKYTLSCKSSDPKIAAVTVDKAKTTAVIKPKAKGKATVTVKITQSGKTYTRTIAVTVSNPYVKITTAKTTMTVGEKQTLVGKTYGLKKTDITWSVSDKSIASLNTKTRELTALKAGEVKVTFKDTISKKSNSVTITVKAAAKPSPTPVPAASTEDLPEHELFEYDVEDGKVIITGVLDSAVTSVTIPNKIGKYAVGAIDDGAFEALYDLKTVKMPSTITRIGDSAFGSCESLTSITIPSGVTEIGDNAFEYCTSLTKLTLPEKLKEMGTNMFEGCEKLASITIPAGVEELPDSTFVGCTALKTVTFSEGLKLIDDSAFEGCTALTSVAFPKSLETINGYAFSGCEALATIKFVSGLETIEDGAFENCISLTSVSLPSGLTYLGSAFSGCTKLSSVTIPKSVEDIGSGAFDDCSEKLKLKVTKGSYAYEYATDEEIPIG